MRSPTRGALVGVMMAVAASAACGSSDSSGGGAVQDDGGPGASSSSGSSGSSGVATPGTPGAPDGGTSGGPATDGASPAPDAATCKADLATDTANCGRCGHGCFGGACQSGVCQEVQLATSLKGVIGVAVDGADVYVAEDGSFAQNFKDGTVKRFPITGGAPATLMTGLAEMGSIAVDATQVFASSRGTTSLNNTDSEIRAVAKAGGTPTVLATNTQCGERIAVGASNVYGVSNSALCTVPKAGGAVTHVPNMNAFNVALSSSALYVDSLVLSPTCTANCFRGGVTAFPLDGSPRKAVVTVANAADPSRSLHGLDVRGSSLYFVTYTHTGAGGVSLKDATLYALDLQVASPPVTLASGLDNIQSQPGALLADASHVYLVLDNYTDWTIVRVPVAGGAVETVARGETRIMAFGLGADYVAWVEEGAPAGAYDRPNGSLRLVAKP